ncbi:hypothetical protein GYMLUDRAFT_83617 [Collybiopsis luxurians FD-317 M1]|uniref:Mitochondrial carrier protein n=1 Tax=Collybiopsis luxurians FD-317 M1 TaxID=944289 RepID=A0A0D0C666_9AGAR|nr:hypothetical protein GYMLUDRAFT_83617 [Collybiopsis luxurians FD-317 M1]
MSITTLEANAQDGGEIRESQASLKAALARTATRGIALYFSRPIRLFRPSKVSGWHSLRGLALLKGDTLSPAFVRNLVKNQGFMVIPRHFVPPMIVNALVGTVLWTTYAETSTLIEPYIGHHPTMMAACAGGVAGGFQAIVAAPAENVRLLLEGGSGYHSWSHAWKDVFRGARSSESTSRKQNIEDARRIRRWMKDVGDMAGRGWDGWGWGCAKDVTGFAIFFSLFEITRRVALQTREQTANFIRTRFSTDESFVRHTSKTIHGMTLVSGGVLAGLAYEFTGRPWDHARRIFHIHRVNHPTYAHSLWLVIPRRIYKDGILLFFRNPNSAQVDGNPSRLTVALRTLGRVGPWGIGFLAWEAFGPGLQI